MTSYSAAIRGFFVISALALTFFSSPSKSSIIASHIGNVSPVTQGWSNDVHAKVYVSGVDSDPGVRGCIAPCPYWRIDDDTSASGTRGRYLHDISSEHYNHVDGWSLNAIVRRSQRQTNVAEPADYAATLYLRFPANNSQSYEFSVQIGINNKNEMTVSVLGSTLLNRPIGFSSDYADIRFVYDPVREQVDFLVNGKVLLEGYSGYLQSFQISDIAFGSGSSASKAATHWNLVTFETAPDTDKDGILDVTERSQFQTNPYLADSDNDGVNDNEELMVNSNPLDRDTDDDGLLDGFEYRYGLSLIEDDAQLDLDNDGLSNIEEMVLNTDPSKQDSDSDGIDDNVELTVYGSKPNDTDSDQDGLSDADEVSLYSSDPANFDTDNDGLSDSEELTLNTNILLSDTDEDGLLDGHETALHKTDPLDPDSDQDGLGDGFEIRYQLNPLISGEQSLDTDLDGLTHLEEFLAGTHPLDADSDKDGLEDSREINELQSNPLVNDTDNDGLLDGFEVLYAFDPLSTGEQFLDSDFDGLNNLDEQLRNTNPRLADTDGDGKQDGQEVFILKSDPLVEDAGIVPKRLRRSLHYSVASTPLFNQPLPETRIPLIDEATLEQINQQNTFGEVHDVKGGAPLWAYQKAWDNGWAECKTTRTFGTPKFCANVSYTPTDSLCRNGGVVDVEALGLECCQNISGHPLVGGTYPDDCGWFGKKNFTLKDVEDLQSGNQIPDTVTIDRGLGSRPTQAPPAADFKAGVIVSTDISASADFVFSAESQDEGELSLDYLTDVQLNVDNSSVQVGEIFRVWVDHKPNPVSAMNSRWSALGFSAHYEIDVEAVATAEYWTIDPEKATQYPHTDFQRSGTLTILDERFYEEGVFTRFTGGASDKLTLEFLTGVNFESVPDFFKDIVFEITADVIDFNDGEVSENIWPGTDDAIPAGTALVISIPNFLYGESSKCPFNFSISGFCFGLGVATNSVKKYFKKFLKPDYSQEMAKLRIQLPEVNTPVSPHFYGGYDNKPGLTWDSQPLLEPRRNDLEAGILRSSVPNGRRPLLNGYSFTAPNFLGINGVRDGSNLSSDTFRLDWDLDGTFSTPGNPGLFDKEYGFSWATIIAGIFDIDISLWMGLDQKLSFHPNLVASVSFDKDVLVRLVSTNNIEHMEQESTLLPAGQIKEIPAQATEYLDLVFPKTWLEVVQPDGGVNMQVTYHFNNNEFYNVTNRNYTVSPTITVGKAAIGGLLGTAMGSPTLQGPKWTPVSAPAGEAFLHNDKWPLAGELNDTSPSFVKIIAVQDDSDKDGILDSIEMLGCTHFQDLDSDDDGVSDGIEDANHNGVVDPGETNPCLIDTDGDGLTDGAELGAVVGITDPDGDGPLLATNEAHFVADTNTAFNTSPLMTDTDDDGYDDALDAFPVDVTEWLDTDNDGIGNNADTDDDGDGVPDEDDAYPLDPTKSQQDPTNVKHDTNGDGNADILWRNTSTGQNWLWTMNGRSIDRSAGINVIADQAWQIVGRGDFDGDGKSDILWRNSDTGRNYIYLMDGHSIKQQGQLNYVNDTNWQVAEVADVDGDGKDDVIWRHATQGRTWIYLMNGMTTKASQGSLTVADLNWEIVASGDINGDDKADVIWRHKTRGDNYVWLMNGTQIDNRYVLNRVASSDWTIAGTGDLNGDGTDDIIWRNQRDGRNWAYLMNDGQIQTSSLINSVSNTNWQIADISDLNGDGKADLFWRQGQTGQSYIYLMNGLSIGSSGYSTTVSPSWQVID